MTPDEELFDEVLSQALQVLRLGANQSAETVQRLAELADKLKANFPVEDLSSLEAKKLQKFFADSEKIIADHYDLFAEADAEDAKSIAQSIAGQTVAALEIALGTEAIKAPKSAYFASLASNVLIEGNPASDWWRGQSLSAQRAFSGAMRTGLLNGETNGQLISRLIGKNGEPGVMDLPRLHATTLVQTSVQAVANDARRAVFDANADVIKGLRQVSTLDGHTSQICVAYSGASWDMKREPLNGSPPFNGGCPRHFKCRSLEVPITKSFRELGLDIDEAPPSTRASADGQIPDGTTFDDFLRRKGKDYQDEVLGPGRADLWREGKITLRDLVSGTGRPLKLAELEAFASQSFSPVVFARQFDQAGVTPADIIDGFAPNTSALIKKTEAKLAKLPETKTAHSVGNSYTEDRLDLHRRILYDGVYGFDPENPETPKFYPGLLDKKAMQKAVPKDGAEPTFTMLGGRGGSGKSAFDGRKYAQAKVYDVDEVLLFDADHIKHMLPEYRGFNAFQVHEESSDLLKQALNLARKSGVNVVLDGTLKSYDGARKLIDAFVGTGYRFEAHYMHLPRQEAAKRAVGRYLTDKKDGSGRYVPVNIVLSNIENELNFMRLFEFADSWSFRDNNVARNTPPRLIAQRKSARVIKKTPKKVEPLLNEVNANHDAAMKAETLQKGLKDRNEHFAAYDSLTGKAFENVVESSGKSHISLTEEFKQTLKDPTKKIVAHHNHPIKRPISLSPQDLMTVAENRGLSGLWAHAEDGSSFYAETSLVTRGAITAVEKRLTKFFNPLVKAGYIDVKAFNDHFAHIVNMALARQKKITYRFNHSDFAKETFGKNTFFIEEFLKSFDK